MGLGVAGLYVSYMAAKNNKSVIAFESNKSSGENPTSSSCETSIWTPDEQAPQYLQGWSDLEKDAKMTLLDRSGGLTIHEKN